MNLQKLCGYFNLKIIAIVCVITALTSCGQTITIHLVSKDGKNVPFEQII